MSVTTPAAWTSKPFEPAGDDNPFITISDGARLGIMLYFLGWRVMPLCAEMTGQIDVGVFYHLLSQFFLIITQILLMLPMVMPRFLGARMGWLHPLVLTAVVTTAMGALENPQSLLVPLLGWFAPYREVTHEIYAGIAQEVLLQARLKSSALTVLSIIVFYIGFAACRLPKRAEHKTREEKHFHPWRFFGIFILCFLVVVYFLNQQGGILNHIASFSSGRFGFREISGPFLVVNDFLPLLLILWYLYKPKSLRNPFFVFAFAMACVFQFIVTGSRGGMFTPVAMLMAAWMVTTHKVPAAQALILGMVGMLLIGVLGEIRRSGSNGEVDFSSLVEFDLTEARELAEAELEGRERDASVAIFVAVPQQVDHLWGRTYLAAIGFWVPRVIWKDKPRGAGAHTAAIIYRGLDTAEGYTGGGIPSSAVSEAYWNFNIGGVILIFVLYGAFTRIMADWYAHKPTDPVRSLFLIIMIFQFKSPTTFQIVNMLQASTMLFIFLSVTRVRRHTVPFHHSSALPGSIARKGIDK